MFYNTLIFIFSCPGYAVPDRSTFFASHLAVEAADVTAKIFTFLIGMFHLTLSYDGWSSKGHDEIYTVHITTPSRRSFLVDGLVLTGLATTGDMIFECLSRVSFLLLLK